MEGALDSGKFFIEVGCDEWVDGGYYESMTKAYGEYDKLVMFRGVVDGYLAKYVKLYDEEGDVLEMHAFLIDKGV